jgi:hypothetical protein
MKQLLTYICTDFFWLKVQRDKPWKRNAKKRVKAFYASLARITKLLDNVSACGTKKQDLILQARARHMPPTIDPFDLVG